MSKYKTTTVIFLLLLLSAAIYRYFLPFSLWYFLPLILIYLTLISIGVFNIRLGFFIKSNYAGNAAKPEISITFDDGPDAINTPQILEILEKENIKATFFCIGKKIKEQENLIKRMNQQGHIIANHTFSHSDFIDFKNTAGWIEEINLTEHTIETIINKKTLLFRPPYGVTNPMIANAVNKLKYKVIGWNLRSMDGTPKPSNIIIDKVCSNVKNGSLVLFHDTHPKIAQILQAFIAHCKKNNLNIVPLTQLINCKPYEN